MLTSRCARRSGGADWGQDLRKGPTMNALVVYESAWGNTRLVAEAISDGLSPT
ncbi:hypothetical protein [Dietzia kunjamensis]|uniref:hypothetical protein n=1 Tax=Dietzia kunjamensis TaxID=322509 RepID=UPI00142EA458|nr:hypothetical protein [Dietzia kunjamensis]MBB1015483.1 hypothetical protein [Dietzia kunjamensis subsp. schimae]